MASFIQEYKPSLQEVSLWVLVLIVSWFTNTWALWLIPFTFSLYNRRKFPELLLCLLTILILANNTHRPLDFINEWRVWYICSLLLFFMLSTTHSQNSTPFTKVSNILKLDFNKYLVIPSTRWIGFIPFFIIACGTTLFSDHTSEGMPRLASYWILLWFIPLFYQEALKIAHRELFQKIFTGIGILLLVGYLWKFYDADFTYMGSYYNGIIRSPRFHGLFGNPNSLGIFCMLFFIWAFSIWRIRPQTLPKLIWVIVFLFLAVNLFLCRSRTETIALLAFLFIWKYPKISKIAIPITLICFILFRYEVTQLIIYIVGVLGLENWVRPETLQIAGGRWIAHEFGWSFIEKHFWLGNGWGYTNKLFIEYTPFLIMRNHLGNAHQSFLTIWLDTGLFGLLAFLMGWCFFLKRAFVRHSRIAFATLIAVLISTNLESWLVASLNPFTILLVLIFSTLSDLNTPKNEKK